MWTQNQIVDRQFEKAPYFFWFPHDLRNKYYDESSRTSFRVLTGVWVLAAMVLVNSYTGIVTSSLTTPKMKPSIDSLEELAARSNIRCFKRFLEIKPGVILIESLSIPKIWQPNWKLATLLTHSCIRSPFHLSVRNVKRKANAPSKSQNNFPFLVEFILCFTKKKVGFRTCDGRRVWFVFGSIIFLPYQGLTNVSEMTNKRKISRLAPIQLSDLTSAFLILGIGIGLATLVFLLETIYSKWGFFYVHRRVNLSRRQAVIVSDCIIRTSYYTVSS
uniref:Ionotropic glutamate receptor C-terminal domain-containing protein n=1 Tax=Daphnia galeata TaxID=27404 RepID=A0A8J2WGZ0_9CRUS|nr:unnamed protein product [Daphnia galeata]